jgi:hypothetical protein
LKEKAPGYIRGEVGEGEHQHTTDKLRVIVVKETSRNDLYFDHDYTPIPGGCIMGDSDSYGTVTTPAYEWDASK